MSSSIGNTSGGPALVCGRMDAPGRANFSMVDAKLQRCLAERAFQVSM
jgi:hypothetical protein